MPDIAHNNSPNSARRENENNGREEIRERKKEVKQVSVSKGKGKRSPKKSKFCKRLPTGCKEEVHLAYPEDLYEKQLKCDESLNRGDKKLTPEEAILRTTGGIELVPLLARRRRVGARTLPSSDVTRPPEQSCQSVPTYYSL